ncbi:MAG: aminodeoxychorismate/anthranilate synthase component II [Eggerthellaceae bacterium]|nr:aminodeoxychorismate/anthranilate synthase component II [Eggerthellaceae bacterium]
MILLIDNYDSFSYNLYQLLGGIDPNIRVIRNDELSVEEIEALEPEKIIISPGPGRPEDAGCIVDAVNHCGTHIPILGVCLGHQAISFAYGATIDYASQLMHGKASTCTIDTTCPLFAGLEDSIQVARYHSLSVVESTLPSDLEICARADDGEIMAIQHKSYPIFGVQFHPESILTPDGVRILQNFLAI